MIESIVLFLFLALLTGIFYKILIPILSLSFIDKPNSRSSHSQSLPTGGGILFVIVGSFVCVILNFWIPLICLPLAIIGLLDDYFSLPRAIRYLAQVITCILLIHYQIDFIDINILPYIVKIPIYISLVFIGTAIINFINFVDGLDGLVSSCFLVILGTSIFIDSKMLMLPMIASLAGFIYWNWSPAKVFMGDCGSTFLGALFFGLVIKQSNPINSLELLIIASPLLLDAFSCLTFRLYSGQNIFKPHKLHLYQRLHQYGWSHQKVACLYCFSCFLISLGLITGGVKIASLLSFLTLIIGLMINNKISFGPMQTNGKI